MENLMNEDWSGEVEETKATSTQISIIEGLLIVASIPEKEKEDIDFCLDSLSEEEAYKTIIYLKEKETFKDPREQWVNHLKRKL